MDRLLLLNGFLLEKARQLASGQTYTIELDWGNPPTERPDYKTFRQNKEKQLGGPGCTSRPQGLNANMENMKK